MKALWHTNSSHQFESPLAQPFICVLLNETGVKRYYSRYSGVHHLTREPSRTLLLTHVREVMREV